MPKYEVKGIIADGKIFTKTCSFPRFMADLNNDRDIETIVRRCLYSLSVKLKGRRYRNWVESCVVDTMKNEYLQVTCYNTYVAPPLVRKKKLTKSESKLRKVKTRKIKTRIKVNCIHHGSDSLLNGYDEPTLKEVKKLK